MKPILKGILVVWAIVLIGCGILAPIAVCVVYSHPILMVIYVITFGGGFVGWAVDWSENLRKTDEEVW